MVVGDQSHVITQVLRFHQYKQPSDSDLTSPHKRQRQ
jgi:hypothetical protein